VAGLAKQWKRVGHGEHLNLDLFLNRNLPGSRRLIKSKITITIKGGIQASVRISENAAVRKCRAPIQSPGGASSVRPAIRAEREFAAWSF
jgi:hypothetical protein